MKLKKKDKSHSRLYLLFHTIYIKLQKIKGTNIFVNLFFKKLPIFISFLLSNISFPLIIIKTGTHHLVAESIILPAHHVLIPLVYIFSTKGAATWRITTVKIDIILNISIYIILDISLDLIIITSLPIFL